MRMIFEENVENEDFIEICLNESEVDKLYNQGVSKEFPSGLNGKRNLNIFLRLDKNLDRFPLQPKKTKMEKVK